VLSNTRNAMPLTVTKSGIYPITISVLPRSDLGQGEGDF
jgi:hypothetical protein